MPKLSYSCSVRKRMIFGTLKSALIWNIGICCCNAWIMSWTTLASSLCGLAMKWGICLSSISSIRFPRFPSKSLIDSILLTLTRNICCFRSIKCLIVKFDAVVIVIGHLNTFLK